MYSYIVAAVYKDKREDVHDIVHKTYVWDLSMLSRVLHNTQAKVRAAGFGACEHWATLGGGQEGHFRYPDARQQGRTAYVLFWAVP